NRMMETPQIRMNLATPMKAQMIQTIRNNQIMVVEVRQQIQINRMMETPQIRMNLATPMKAEMIQTIRNNQIMVAEVRQPTQTTRMASAQHIQMAQVIQTKGQVIQLPQVSRLTPIILITLRSLIMKMIRAISVIIINEYNQIGLQTHHDLMCKDQLKMKSLMVSKTTLHKGLIRITNIAN